MDNNDGSSSDSSIDNHFQLPDKINFNSSFFNSTNQQKSNINNTTNKITSKNYHYDEQESNSDDTDDDFIEEENISSTALLAEVMKNLEKLESNAISINNKTNTPQSPLPSTSHQINHHDTENDSLSNEINDLLLQGETDLGASNFQSFNNYDNTDNNIVECNNQSDYSVPKDGVVITLPDDRLIFNRRKKRGIDLIDELRKKLNRRLRLNQIFVHKVGILCWLAHSFHLNQQINDPELMSIALSLIPQNSYPTSRVDLKYLEQFTKWFKTLIKIDKVDKKEMNKKNINESDSTISITKDVLIKGLANKKVNNYRELVLLYVCALRAIGINSRLIVSFYPPNLKPNHHNLFQSKNLKNEDETKINNETKRKRKSPIIKYESKNNKKLKIMNNYENEDIDDDELKPINIIPRNSKQATNIAANDAKKRATEIISLKYMKNKNMKKKFDHDIKKKILIDEENEIINPAQVRHMRSRIASNENSEKKPLVKYFKAPNLSNEFEHESKDKAENKVNSLMYVRQLRSRNILNKNPKKIFVKNIETSSSTITKKNSKDEDDDDDDDYSDKDEKHKKKESKKKYTKIKVNNNSSRNNSRSKHDKTIDRRVLSSDEEMENENQINILNNGYYYLWAEVYVESEENWICVNVPDDKIHCVSTIYKKLPMPVLYIIAFNSIGKIKDVTRRYCNNWLTVTRKQRVDEIWLNDTLLPWREAQTAVSKVEDESLLQREMEQPLPKSISECKGHPLYALARHLLKFEALYPPDCVPLGHLKNGEAIYSRHCVHTLRSRETWLKQARVVKPAQEPYKIVKAMPKYDKLSGIMIKDLPLELFGHWQTMAYVPPEAKNGKVPRNEYGNVDLFKKCMLPKGTVHIDLPGLFRVAKKLNIDCVAAVVGFNFGGRGAMPMTQGYVVCEEYEDILREAWEEEQAKVAARAKEKRDKRIWGNWRKLIRGLFIREKIIAKYSAQENEYDNINNNNDDDDNNNDHEKSTKRGKKIKKK